MERRNFDPPFFVPPGKSFHGKPAEGLAGWFAIAGAGQKTLTWASTGGTSYQLQATNDLTDPEAWEDLGNAILATTTQTSVTFDFPITATPRFWRVKEIPPP